MGRKNLALKMWLVHKHRQNRGVPIFVRLRTNRKVMRNPHQRNWRYNKLNTYYMRKKVFKE